MRRGAAAAVANGLVAGALAGLAMALLAVILRLIGGVPLLSELASDRIVPLLSIRQFGRLAAALGGLRRGKEFALIGGFAAQVVAATFAGGLAGLVLLSGLPRRVRRLPVALALILCLATGLTVFLLWPVLGSNYRGLGSTPATVTNAVAIVASFALYGVVFALALGAMARPTAERQAGADPAPAGRVVGRRALLRGAVGAGLALLAAGGVDLLFRKATVGPNGYDGLGVRGPQTLSITPNDRFYVVTKNLIDPMVDSSLWQLRVSGLVDRERSFGLDDLMALPSRTQIQTLECISNGVGGGLMSTAAWRGVPLAALLAVAQPRPEARFVLLRAADGYTHGIPLDRAMDPSSLVAYEMNGAPLPNRHGYPARVLIPGTYGEVNVKWVERIDVVDRSVEGYYEQQGWRPGFVHTTSRFDRPFDGQRVALSREPRVPVGGIAFAGDRGVSKVESSFDGGASWRVARIDHAAGNLAWVLWSAPWTPPGPGTYQLAVRATDGTGTTQTAVRRGSAPSGATGYHQIQVAVTP